MSYPDIDTLPSKRALQILIGQYADSTDLKTYITNLMSEFDLLHANSVLALTTRSLDVATKYNLDILGILVGQPRGVEVSVAGVFFGFDGAIGAGTFGTEGDSAVGAVFASKSDVQYNKVPWSDTTYRKFIRARILKNNRAITINTIIEVIWAVMDGKPDVVVTNTTPTNFNIYFPEVLTNEDKLLLTTNGLIPRPVGVAYTLQDDNGFIT